MEIGMPWVSEADRAYRRAMGWVLRGRHTWTKRHELFARGWCWDQKAGGMLAPDQAEYDEWAPPPAAEGDTIIRCGGRYHGWPVRLLPTKYLLWFAGPQCGMASDAERQAAREELTRRRAEQQRAERAATARQRADPEAEAERAFRDRWLPVWGAMPAEERAVIERAVDAAYPSAKALKSHRETLCLRELGRRRDDAAASTGEGEHGKRA